MKFTSPVYSAASGSIAGITYSRSAQGMYTRARAVPVNPSSTRQQIMRMYLDSVVTYWTETLTEAERESWRTYAANVPVIDRLGQSVHLSGQQHWIRSGVPWLLGGQDLADIATAPTIFDTGDPGTLSLTSVTAPSAILIGIAGAPGWAAEDEGRLFIFTSQPQNPSISFYKSPFRFVDAVPGAVGAPITTAARATTAATPPITVAAGQRLFVRVRAQYGDGRLTQAFIFDDIAV